MTSEAPPQTAEHVRVRLRLASDSIGFAPLRGARHLERSAAKLDLFVRILAFQDV